MKNNKPNKKEKNVTKNSLDGLNPIEARVKDVISEASYDPSFKDHLAGRLEATIDNIKESNKMESKQKEKSSAGGFKWPILAIPLVGAFALMIWGIIVIYNQQITEPEVTHSDPDPSVKESIEEFAPKELNFDLVSESVFKSEVHKCFNNCSPEELFEEALEISEDIHSYKVMYSYQGRSGGDKYVKGYQNLKEKGRYLTSTASFDAHYTEELLVFTEWKMVRKFDEKGNWQSNDVVNGSFNLEPYGYDNALGFIGEDGWVVDDYEVNEEGKNKQITLKGHSEHVSGGGTGFSFTAEIVVLRNLYISSVDLDIETDDGVIEEKIYNYSDFERNYGIYAPKMVAMNIFEENGTGKALYEYALEQTEETRGSYMVIYKSDEDEPFNYAKGYDYEPFPNPGAITIPYAQYTLSFPIGKQQEVYIDETRYTRDYVESSDKWSDWRIDKSEDGWNDAEMSRYQAGLILRKYSEESDWRIEEYNLSDSVSEYQKIVSLSLSGVGENEGKSATLRITVSAATTINRIEVLVMEDGEYLYKTSYDYFKHGYDFVEDVADPEGKLAEEQNRNMPLSARPANDKKDEDEEIPVGDNTVYWDYNGQKIPVKLRTFWVEFRPGDGGVVKLEAAVPEDAVITGSTISFMNAELIFKIPHMGFDEHYTHVQWVDTPHFDQLYRVQVENAGYFYSSEVMFNNVCYDPEGEVEAPCGPTNLEFENEEFDNSPLITVQYKGVNEKMSFADKIMGTVKMVDYKSQQ